MSNSLPELFLRHKNNPILCVNDLAVPGEQRL